MSSRYASRIVVDALPFSRPSNYVCHRCRRNPNLQPTQTLPVQRRHASNQHQRQEELPFAEKVRRKLWKGKPPGPENIDDVYGKGFLDTIKEERQKTAAKKRELADVDRELKEAEAVLAAQERGDGAVGAKGVEGQAFGNHEYKEAKTWDGLEAVGYKGDWREMPVKDVDEYTPWLDTSNPPARTYEELGSLMQQATVQAYEAEGLVYEPEAFDLNGKLDMSQPISFKILKRFMALTQYHIPDPLITALAAPGAHGITLSGLLRAIEENVAPKPANLAERLMGDEVLAAQSNLLILGRRETPVDKEKEVGRWKIIEAELRARGLPVLGKAEIQR